MKNLLCCLVAITTADHLELNSAQKIKFEQLSVKLKKERKQEYQRMYDRASMELEREVLNKVKVIKTAKNVNYAEVKESIEEEIKK